MRFVNAWRSLADVLWDDGNHCGHPRRSPGDKRRWPSIGRAGFCYEAEIHDDHDRPLPAGEIGEICIKGVQGKPSSKSIFSTESHCESAGSRRLATYRQYRILRRRGLFLFRRSPLQYNQTRWRESLLRGAGKYSSPPIQKFRISWLWVLKIRFAMKPSKHLWC